MNDASQPLHYFTHKRKEIGMLRSIIAFVTVIIVSNCLFAQTQTHSFNYDGVLRSYIVFLPQGYNATTNFSVVFNLHGYGDTAQNQMNYSMMNIVADTAGFMVVYPDAVNRRWNSGIFDNPNWPTPNVDDVGFINALIDTLHHQYSSAHQWYDGLAFGRSNFKLLGKL